MAWKDDNLALEDFGLTNDHPFAREDLIAGEPASFQKELLSGINFLKDRMQRSMARENDAINNMANTIWKGMQFFWGVCLGSTQLCYAFVVYFFFRSILDLFFVYFRSVSVGFRSIFVSYWVVIGWFLAYFGLRHFMFVFWSIFYHLVSFGPILGLFLVPFYWLTFVDFWSTFPDF